MKSFLLVLGMGVFSINVAWACPDNEFCVGERVNFDGYLSGKVHKVLANGRISIDQDGSSAYPIRQAKDLAKGLVCVGNICSSNRVYFNDSEGHNLDLVGKVIEVFTNGQVKIRRDGVGSYHYRNMSDILKGCKCVENVCENKRVDFNDSHTGVIDALFENGLVRVKKLGSSSVYDFRTLGQMGFEIDCSGDKPCTCRN